jgi:hypothetical protein
MLRRFEVGLPEPGFEAGGLSTPSHTQKPKNQTMVLEQTVAHVLQKSTLMQRDSGIRRAPDKTCLFPFPDIGPPVLFSRRSIHA